MNICEARGGYLFQARYEKQGGGGGDGGAVRFSFQV